MCSSMFKAPSMPAPPPPAPLPEPLKDADERIAAGRANTRKKAAALASLSNTRLTSPLGLTNQASTSQASLLGQ
jgi:hypothetical protein